MSKARAVVVGAAFLLAASIPLLVISRDEGTSRQPQYPGVGSGFLAPHEIPFSNADEVTLSTAVSSVPYPLYRPNHPLASDEGIVEVWVQTAASPSDSEDSEAQVAIWYSSGLEVHLSPVSPNDDSPLVSDFPKELPVSYEMLGETKVRVIPPGVMAEGQPGSVTMVKGGLLITLFGWLPDLTEKELREIASTVSSDPSTS